MPCMVENQGGADVEICRGEDPINLYDYASHEGQVFLQFEDVSGGDWYLNYLFKGHSQRLLYKVQCTAVIKPII